MLGQLQAWIWVGVEPSSHWDFRTQSFLGIVCGARGRVGVGMEGGTVPCAPLSQARTRQGSLGLPHRLGFLAWVRVRVGEIVPGRRLQ